MPLGMYQQPQTITRGWEPISAESANHGALQIEYHAEKVLIELTPHVSSLSKDQRSVQLIIILKEDHIL